MDPEVVAWLLEGDAAIRYQTSRDLLGRERPELRRRIAREGWGAALLKARNSDGAWGRRFYQPKWACTHYTLLDLKSLAINPAVPGIRSLVERIAREEKGCDGGINPARSIAQSELCVSGMFLDYACYFGTPPAALASVVDFVLAERMPDGGFNCCRNRQGARHSSMHTTISVLEGIASYSRSGYAYRVDELLGAGDAAREFLLRHRLFRSDRTGEVIHPGFLKPTFPPRWRYDVLRALDHFRAAGVPFDPRLADALSVVRGRRRRDGRWRGGAAYPGEVHLTMETPGKPSRWITLIGLRVLRAYDEPQASG